MNLETYESSESENDLLLDVSPEALSHKPLMMKSSSKSSPLGILKKHNSLYSAVIRKWIVWLLVFGFLIFFYISTNCWTNNLGGFFLNNNRRYQPKTISLQGQAINGSNVAVVPKKSSTTSKYGRIRSLVRPSILARPLRNLSQSFTVKSLNIQKLQNLFKNANYSLSKENLLDCSGSQFWNEHRESYKRRRSRILEVCKRYGFLNRIFTTWHISTNRKVIPTWKHNRTINDHKICTTRNCPLIVNKEHHLLTCFVQKVASTSIKRLYLYLMNHENLSANVSEQLFQPIKNLSNFHYRMNDELYRISPTYLAYAKESNYFKTIFVRHPFVRVVSAFKDKAERNSSEETYFYTHYWNPLLDRLHGKQRDPNMRVTFPEFVELLLTTDPYQYDEHWAPIWTRCEPCFIHYDFIGKLETGEEDFRNFKSRANKNLINVTIWENLNHQFGLQMPINDNHSKLTLNSCQQQRLKYAETIHYLSQLSSQSLIELYKRYYLDFELFGYTLEELFEVITTMVI